MKIIMLDLSNTIKIELLNYITIIKSYRGDQ